MTTKINSALSLYNFRYNMSSRDVAQLGSALPWGGRGREFKSHRSDHFYETSPVFYLHINTLLTITH